MVVALAALLALQKPNLVYRWVYVGTNLLVPANEKQIEDLMVRAKAAGYNGIVLTDSKMERLASEPPEYFANARKLAAKASEVGMNIIPVFANVGWADSLLSSNPNLVESEPVRGAVFKVLGSVAEFVPDPQAAYRNGGFEDANGDQLRQVGFQDLPGQETFVDHSVFLSGTSSLRMTSPEGNCRLMEEIPVTPHRQYHFSVWAKTAGLDSQFEIKALDANSQAMSEQNPGIKKDQDWTQEHMTFNSGDSKVARIYMGFWGGHRGSIWLDDASLEEVGLLNVVRRPSCPVTVRASDGTIYAEGKDYERIEDPKMGNVPWPGAFEVYHAGPSIHIPAGSRIHDGEKLSVDFNAAVVLADGKVSICLSDPATDAILLDSAKRLEDLFHPAGFFLGHDEIRSGGTCDGCVATHKTPGQILARNLSKCVGFAEKVHRGEETFVWSDMFDPSHNAVAHYYLNLGSLEGSWEGLPKRTVVVNWNYGGRAKSLPFFAARGNRQILAGYYDHDPSEIKTWLHDAEGVTGVCGVMYTTWQNNYADLELFAKAAWGTASGGTSPKASRPGPSWTSCLGAPAWTLL